MNTALQTWNSADEPEAIRQLLHCCAAQRWAQALTAQRPLLNEEALFHAGDTVWATMQEPDWMDAFAAHPRIGERKAAAASAESAAWSSQEQSSVDTAQTQLLRLLAEANARYEDTFGFTYIVCATGKSAEQMLDILKRRLGNTREAELREAAEQQRQITQIRLRKWLQGESKP